MTAENKPSYFGENLDDKQCEIIQLTRFGGGERAFKKHLKLELQLLQSKWHDYKLLHPVVATYRYAHEFTKTYRRYYSMTLDHERGQYVTGFKGKDPWLATNSGGFIRGRQQADSMGIPYDFYISAAYNFLYIKKWKHIARPCHLYAEDVIAHIEEAWRNYSTSALIFAEDTFFKDIANGERPEFIAHQHWIENRLALSKVKDLARASLHDRGYITSPSIISHG